MKIAIASDHRGFPTKQELIKYLSKKNYEVLDYGTNTTLSHYHKPNNINPRMPFYNGTRGTLVTTEDYVTEMFGELKYVCLAKNQKDYGIFITDYTADAILSYSKKYLY